MRPARPLLAAVVLTGALLAAAGPSHAVTEACWDDVGTDFDGGGPDVVVGLPSYDLPGKPDAGAIAVFSNVAAAGEADPSEPTASYLVTADDIDGLASQAGARFGASVVVWGDAGEFDDADDCADLLVGAPGESIDGKAGAGQVLMLKGTGDGFADTILTLDEATIPGTGGAQAGAGFGSALAGSTLGMIAVGAPGRDVGAAADAGRVVRLTYPLNDITDPDYLVVEQGGDNPGAAESGDRFGEVLDALPSGQGDILVIGIPHEDIGTKSDAGAVGLLPLPGPLTMVNQDSAGAGGTAETGDLYGSAIDIYATFTTTAVGVVAIGVPGEDNNGGEDAGAVAYASFDIVFDPTEYVGPITGMPNTVNQDTAGVPGKAEPGDAYGASVLVGEFGTDSGVRQLVSTAPLENVGSVSNAGQLSMTRIEEDGVPKTDVQAGAWTQDSKGVSGKAEAGDRFGTRVSSVLLTSLEDDDDSIWDVALVTVPREDVGDVVDAGMAYLGTGAGNHSIALAMPVAQAGAGIGMVPMRYPF